MADQENPITVPTEISGVDVLPNDPNVNREGRTGTTFGVDDLDDYNQHIEDEFRKLQAQVQRLEARWNQPPVTSSIPPPISVPLSSQPFQTQGVSVPLSMPFVNPGFGDQRYPEFLTQQPKKLCSFKTFMASKPSEYHGSSNPAVTMDWLRDIEKKFVVCRCEEEIKVPYAVQLLKGQANVWWDSLIATLTPQQCESIRWSDFHNEVCKRFCNDYDMTRIRQEFLDLKLTDKMTIDELIAKFSEKLRFVQEWVPNDKTKVDHFVRTLPSEYRTTVRLAGTLTQAYNLARSVDEDLRSRVVLSKDKSTSSSRSSDKGKQKVQGKGSGYRGSLTSRQDWCSKCRSRHTGPCTVQTNRCLKCGELGHDVKDCKYPNYVCWNCKKEGHRVNRCPEVRSQGTGTVGGSSSAGQKRKAAPTASGRAFQMTVDEAIRTEDVITDTQKTQ